MSSSENAPAITSSNSKTDIAAKAAELPNFFTGRVQTYTPKDLTEEEIANHLVDWSRLGVDQGHIWRFPKTSNCHLRLPFERIRGALPSAARLLQIWELNTNISKVPDLSGDRSLIALEDSFESNTLTYLARTWADKLSVLHSTVHLVPHERYLSSVIWSTLRLGTRIQVVEVRKAGIAAEDADKLVELVSKGENPYWGQSEVTRWTGVPPIVCAADYDDARWDLWREAFTPSREETRLEAQRQLRTLENFKAYFVANVKPNLVGLWQGNKQISFEDPNNYCEVNHKAPPACVFRRDQDLSYSREAVEKSGGTKVDSHERLSSNVYADIDQQRWNVEYGPGSLPNRDWNQDLADFVARPENLQAPSNNPKVQAAARQTPDPPGYSPISSITSETWDTLLTEVEYALKTAENASRPPSKMAVPTDSTATPQGSLINLSMISDQDVTIFHRDPEGQINRQVFNGQNAGAIFRAEGHTRVDYAAHPEWPLINTYPAHMFHDMSGKISAQDFHTHCKPHTVLSDFWVHHALRLEIENRADNWKLNFNSEGWLAGNFVPHGAAAVTKDDQGALRFVIWDGMQLHGDVGERLALKKRLSRGEWNTKRNEVHPGVPTKDAKGGKGHFQAWGDLCPKDYRPPPDWDVLGHLPSKETVKQAPDQQHSSQPEPIKPGFTPINTAQPQPTSGGNYGIAPPINTAQPQPTSGSDYGIAPQPATSIDLYTPGRGFAQPTAMNASQKFGFLPDASSIHAPAALNASRKFGFLPDASSIHTPARTYDTKVGLFGGVPEHPYAPTAPRHASSTFRAGSTRPYQLPRQSPTSSSRSTDISMTRQPKHPKRRMITQQATDPIEKRVETLTKENLELKNLRNFADAKIRALVVFGAHQDDAINLLANQFSELQTKLQARTGIDLDQVAADVNHIVDRAMHAVTELASEYPTTEDLVSVHENQEDFSTSAALAEWLSGLDHIQMADEERLRDADLYGDD